jgi:type I restriction enzyme S subunit
MRVDAGRVDPRYLNYWMNGPAGRRQMQRIITRAVGQANVNPTQLREAIRVPLPPMAEQKRIADILDSWRSAIEKTNELAGLARRHRLGLFREAATKSPADAASLGDLCTASKGGALSKGDLSPNGASRCILYGELHTTYGQVATHIVGRTGVTSGVASHGDEILMPSASETAEDLASATAVQQPGVLLGGDMIVLRPRERRLYEPAYLAHYITHMRRREVASLAQGNSVAHLYGRDVLRIKVSLPSFERQRLIAELMSSAQAEIDHLELLAGGHRKQRDGLMQVLFDDGAGR